MLHDRSVVLHIGFMKTGTTALQTNLFPSCRELSYFGKPFSALATAIRAITMLDNEEWDRSYAAIESDISRALLFCGPRILISEEEFSSGGERDSPVDRAMIATRLHQLFPHATIVLVIRNQLAAIQSLYGYVMGRADQYVPFNDWFGIERRDDFPARGLDLFDYAALVRTYVTRFSRERVNVLFYEDMVAQYDVFVRALAAAIEVDGDQLAAITLERRNVRPSARKVRAMQMSRRSPWLGRAIERLPAKLVDRIGAYIDGGPPLNVGYTAENRAFVSRRYAACNRDLGALLRIDQGALSERGYPCW